MYLYANSYVSINCITMYIYTYISVYLHPHINVTICLHLFLDPCLYNYRYFLSLVEVKVDTLHLIHFVTLLLNLDVCR